MEQEKLNLGIGTKEPAKLEPKIVKAVGVRIDMRKNKEGKDVGEMVTVICKHPDKEEFIELSQVSYLKDKSVKTVGLWVQLDSDKLILKNSALAQLLVFAKAATPNDLVGKDLPTDKEDRGYLCLKAY